MNAPARTRPLIGMESRPRLPRHVRIQFDPVRRQFAVLAPEKVFWPGETGLAILRLVDGRTSVAQMVSRLAEDYGAPQDVIAQDVIAFLEEWSDNMLLRVDKAGEGEARTACASASPDVRDRTVP
jgi:pyrroloquinoline quinone biosynthesis protein D